MSERCIALLRGVNLGGRKRVPMAELRQLVEDVGYTGVRTLLNSGNVVFTARADRVRGAAGRIERAVLEGLGVSARVVVLTTDELRRTLAANPIAALCDDPSRMLIAVFTDPAARAKAETLLQESWEPEVLAVGTRAAYLWCGDGISAGRLAEAVDRTLRDGVTARNLRTMMKLLEA